jgi:hypothetical protein
MEGIRKGSINNNFFIIFLKCILWLVLGGAVGFLFFSFFKNQAVYFINKFRIIQGIFGIREYKQGMTYSSVLLTVLAGNLISTAAYFVLGYVRTLIPASIITGFFVIIFLMAGTVTHATALPLEVILLSSLETFYRALALTTGEYIQKNKFGRKAVPVIAIVTIILLLVVAVIYEMGQIFG